MGNIVTIVNGQTITIDISGITADQLRLLKESINYQDTVADPDHAGQMMDNPVPVIAAVTMEDWKNRAVKMTNILSNENYQAAQAGVASVMGTFI